ncbi:MAG: hypothetical protein ACPGQM_13510 [Alphaproteobacteria bacterium]
MPERAGNIDATGPGSKPLSLSSSGDLHQERSSHARRSVRVKLTEKGLELSRLLEQMFERHVAAVEHSIDKENLAAANESLRDVERFWLQQLGFGPRVAKFSRVETAV